MRNPFRTVLGVAFTLFGLSGMAPSSVATPVEPEKQAVLKPDVAALLKQSTEAYLKMKSYQHTAAVTLSGTIEGKKVELTQRYTLALERPNKFCYKLNEGAANAVAVCDGKTFINYKNDVEQNQYMQKPAPADYKGINIVDDVLFDPMGTYFVALMLQGDALADKDVRAAMEKASMKASVTEDGKKWQVMHVLFGPNENPYDFYFNADDHLIGKVVTRVKIPASDQFPGAEMPNTEILKDVRINKPIDASVFEYKPPANAKKVNKFTTPQRPDDASNAPAPLSSPKLSLAAFHRADAKSDVAALLKESVAAYQKFKSYQHTSVSKIISMADGKTLEQTEKCYLAVEKPNKSYFKSVEVDDKVTEIVSDGKNNFAFQNQLNEYTKTKAPADYKSIDAGGSVSLGPPCTSMVVLLLQGNAEGLVEGLGDATVKNGIMEGGKKWSVITTTITGNTMKLYFDAATHLLSKLVVKVPDEGSMTETLTDIKTNQPIDPKLLQYTPPKTAKLVDKFTDPQEAAGKKLTDKYEGKPASDFTLKDHDGKEVSLASLKGKVVIVDFWASWCGPCREVMPTLQEIHEKFGSEVVVLAVDSFDEKADCDKFLKENPKYTMRVLMDPAGTNSDKSIAATHYGVESIPTTLIIDKEGVLRKYLVGSHEREVYMGILKDLGIRDAK